MPEIDAAASCPFAKSAAKTDAVCPVSGRSGGSVETKTETDSVDTAPSTFGNGQNGGGGCTLMTGGLNVTFVMPNRDRIPVRNLTKSFTFETVISLLHHSGVELPEYMAWSDMRVRSGQTGLLFSTKSYIHETDIRDNDVLFLEPDPKSGSGRLFTSFAKEETLSFAVLILPDLCTTPEVLDGISVLVTMKEVRAVLTHKFHTDLTQYDVSLRPHGTDASELPVDNDALLADLIVDAGDTLILRARSLPQSVMSRGWGAVSRLLAWADNAVFGESDKAS